jgi:hypothetical protein
MAPHSALQEARVACDLDDARRVAGDHVVTFGQQWEEGHGHEELRRDIGCKHVLPALRVRLHVVRRNCLRVCWVWLAMELKSGFVVESNACVVDEELDASGLEAGDLGRELLNSLFATDVRCDPVRSC